METLNILIEFGFAVFAISTLTLILFYVASRDE